MNYSRARSNPKLALNTKQRKALGAKLQRLRVSRSLTQLEVADKALGLNKSHAAVSRLERGVLPEVAPERLAALGTFYGVSLNELLTPDVPKSKSQPEAVLENIDGWVVADGVGARLTRIRTAAGLTFRQLALRLGHKQPTMVRLWESGQVRPKPDTLLNIAVKLEVSAAWLITGIHAKPVAPSPAMRLQALQKAYGLSNQEVANMAGLDVVYGDKAVGRFARGRKLGPDNFRAIATAFDVPVSWLVPPSDAVMEELDVASASALPVPVELSAAQRKFLGELAQLMTMETLEAFELANIRATLLKQVVQRSYRKGQKPAKAQD